MIKRWRGGIDGREGSGGWGEGYGVHLEGQIFNLYCCNGRRLE